MQEIKPWVMLANGLDRVARKLDGAVEVLGRAQMWCLNRHVHGEVGPVPSPQHFHHVHISGTTALWDIAQIDPPAEDR